MRSRTDTDLREIDARWPVLAGQTVAIVVQSADGKHEELCWTFGAQRERAAGQPAGGGELSHNGNGSADGPVATVIGGPDVWRSLLNGEANIVSEMTAGRLRCVNRRDGHRIRSDELHALAALLGLIRVPVALAANEL